MSLVEKLRKSRELIEEVEGFKFTIRRPTDKEAAELRGKDFVWIAQWGVIDWSGVREIDILPGGTPTEVPFDVELWKEWSADHPEFWVPLANAVMASYLNHREKREETKKKP